MNDQLRPPGLLGWFALNHVAANLLMILVIVAGVMSLMFIKVEVFPEVSVDMVRISVPYLGASPEEVEQGVCLRVEEAIAAVEGVQEIRSVAAEGIGTIIAELDDYADVQTVLEDIKTQVDRIETFPAETEKPIITDLTNRTQVLSIALYGQASERTLKNLADRVRDDLTALDNISQVEVAGVRRFEISIEIAEETLRRYGLSFDQVTRAVNQSSLDLPGGSVKTRGGDVLLRTKGQKYRGAEFENIIVMTRPDGTKLQLKDIAKVIDGFEDSDAGARFNGKPAAFLNVFRIGEQGAIDVADTVKTYVEDLRPRLPAGIEAATWYDNSNYLKSRISLLSRNALIGVILVLLCLTFFLDLRLAFWTTMGIPISFLGAFILLPHFDVSINMLSLFAFIMALGIVVDDAIVVGENVFAYRQRGLTHLEAAVAGAREMVAPVTMAILTTIAAFVPLINVEGMLGKFIRVIPLVVISVLVLSLVEAFLILPAHLSGSRAPTALGPIGRLQKLFRAGMEWIIRVPFRKLLDTAIAWRYATLATGISLFIATIGYIAGGHIKFVFMENMDADFMIATLSMPQGTSRRQTEAVVQRLEEAAFVVQAQVTGDDQNADGIIKNMATHIGQQPLSTQQGGPNGGGLVTVSGSHLAEIVVELVSGQERTIASQELANRWREAVGDVSGLSSLNFTAAMFSAGDAVNVELSHRDFNSLLKASERLKTMLGEYEGVSEIADNFELGKMELQLKLTDQGRTLGLTLGDLAHQVRQGFYGEEVQRIQRGRDDIRVMLRYPQAQRRNIADVNNMRVRLVDGTEIPFSLVADVRQGRGYASINRTARQRVVRVTAAVDETVANAQKINAELQNILLPDLREEYPGLRFSFEGEERERQKSMSSLRRNFIVALLAIFGLLAVQFRSYIQPVIIMSAIPFGLIGAVIGHVLMGFNMSILSMFGIVALTGVVVNDSLILIDLINRQRGKGLDISRVVLESAQRRFRPIILTTLTTFFGLMPMILETSLQARFLIPMAISLAFGVLFATAITLVLVPSLYVILEDVRSLFGLSDRLSEPPQELKLEL